MIIKKNFVYDIKAELLQHYQGTEKRIETHKKYEVIEIEIGQSSSSIIVLDQHGSECYFNFLDCNWKITCNDETVDIFESWMFNHYIQPNHVGIKTTSSYKLSKIIAKLNSIYINESIIYDSEANVIMSGNHIFKSTFAYLVDYKIVKIVPMYQKSLKWLFDLMINETHIEGEL